MKVSSTFKIRRYWLDHLVPEWVLAQLNVKWGFYPKDGNLRQNPRYKSKDLRLWYVDINYWGESDKNLTIMELKYGDWVIDREEIEYTVEGDDGLE